MPAADEFAGTVCHLHTLVPINVASWNQMNLPVRWRCKPRVRAAWLHENTYQALGFARQSLSKQLTTFGHALKRMLVTMEVPASLIKAASLQNCGTSLKHQSITAVPEVCKSFSKLLCDIAQRKPLPALARAVYNPPAAPQECDVAQISPTILWNLCFSKRR